MTTLSRVPLDHENFVPSAGEADTAGADFPRIETSLSICSRLCRKAAWGSSLAHARRIETISSDFIASTAVWSASKYSMDGRLSEGFDFSRSLDTPSDSAGRAHLGPIRTIQF